MLVRAPALAVTVWSEPVGVMVRSTSSGRWSESPWWNHSAAETTAVAPTTWMPTRRPGAG